MFKLLFLIPAIFLFGCADEIDKMKNRITEGNAYGRNYRDDLEKSRIGLAFKVGTICANCQFVKTHPELFESEAGKKFKKNCVEFNFGTPEGYFKWHEEKVEKE